MVTPYLERPDVSTTSLKLPEDVKQLAAAAAKQQGVTPHAFMVDAIRAAATNAERRAQFVADAVASRTEAVKSGRSEEHTSELQSLMRISSAVFCLKNKKHT